MELIFHYKAEVDPVAIYVAIYAAIVATAILIWDIAKWLRSGPRIKLRTMPNMEWFNATGQIRKGETYVIVMVTNVGSSPTTITHLTLAYFKNHMDRLRQKFEMRAVIMIAQAASHLPLPQVLKPGEDWSGMILQNDELVQMAVNGVLYAEVIDSVNKRPTRVRITIPADKPG